eukprot:ctg_392.g243
MGDAGSAAMNGGEGAAPPTAGAAAPLQIPVSDVADDIAVAYGANDIDTVGGSRPSLASCFRARATARPEGSAAGERPPLTAGPRHGSRGRPEARRRRRLAVRPGGPLHHSVICWRALALGAAATAMPPLLRRCTLCIRGLTARRRRRARRGLAGHAIVRRAGIGRGRGPVAQVAAQARAAEVGATAPRERDAQVYRFHLDAVEQLAARALWPKTRPGVLAAGAAAPEQGGARGVAAVCPNARRFVGHAFTAVRQLPVAFAGAVAVGAGRSADGRRGDGDEGDDDDSQVGRDPSSASRRSRPRALSAELVCAIGAFRAAALLARGGLFTHRAARRLQRGRAHSAGDRGADDAPGAGGCRSVWTHGGAAVRARLAGRSQGAEAATVSMSDSDAEHSEQYAAAEATAPADDSVSDDVADAMPAVRLEADPATPHDPNNIVLREMSASQRAHLREWLRVFGVYLGAGARHGSGSPQALRVPRAAPPQRPAGIGAAVGVLAHRTAPPPGAAHSDRRSGGVFHQGARAVPGGGGGAGSGAGRGSTR